eukprot:gene11744-2138_t
MPNRYEITLRPDLDKWTFAGEEVLIVHLAEEAQCMELHAVDMEVSDVSLIEPSACAGTATPGNRPAHFWPNPASWSCEGLTLLAVQALIPLCQCLQQWIRLKFSGCIQARLLGFYRCPQTLSDGTVIPCAATHFEPVSARFAFPCMDEPARRSVFSITIIVPDLPGRTVLSNMPPAAITNLGDLVEYAFEDTIPMPAYLIAYYVGQAECLEAEACGIPVRVYTPLGQKELGAYTLKVATYVLAWLSDYFDVQPTLRSILAHLISFCPVSDIPSPAPTRKVPYPLPKMDLLIPPEMPIGGMENWGLIILHPCVLLDPSSAPLGRQQGTALLVSHELSHMWFGDLVSIEWWDHLWLKEGFADWVNKLPFDQSTEVSVVAAGAVLPFVAVVVAEPWSHWRVFTSWHANDKGSAMCTDQCEATHPVHVHVNHPSEINEIFDALSYKKGASLVHMLHQYLGKDPFSPALSLAWQRYPLFHLWGAWLPTTAPTQEYQHTAVDTSALWKVMDRESGRPVSLLMQVWASQPGFPGVEVWQDGNGIHGRQRRFVVSRTADDHADDLSVWPTPLTVCFGTGQAPVGAKKKVMSALLEEQQGRLVSIPAELVIGSDAGADAEEPQQVEEPADWWVKVNYEESTMVRVAYSRPLLRKLQAPVYRRLLGPVDRLGLLNDVFSMTY